MPQTKKQSKLPKEHFEVLLEDINGKFDFIAEHMSGHTTRLDKIDKKLESHDNQLVKIEMHLKNHDDKFDKIEKHLKRHDDKFDKIDKKLTNHDKQFDKINTRLTKIEEDVAVIKLDIEFIKHELKQKVNRDEFSALEKRLSLLENKFATNL